MLLILALLHLLFGSTSLRLGDSRFAVRDAAHRELQSWQPLAGFYLNHCGSPLGSEAGTQPHWCSTAQQRPAFSSAEWQLRCEMLQLGDTTLLDWYLARFFARIDVQQPMTPARQKLFEDAAPAVCYAADRLHLFYTRPSFTWAKAKQYVSGSFGGDVVVVAGYSRCKLLGVENDWK